MVIMKSLKLTVKGIVQKVGYRNTVYRAARKMGINGYVKNLDDPKESVEAVIQHPDEKVLEEFIDKIKINDGIVEVHEIVKEKIEEKEFPKFEIIRGSPEEESAERLDVAEMQLKTLTGAVYIVGEKVEAGNENLGGKIDGLGGKIDGLGAKIDITNNSIQVLTVKTDKVAENLNSFANATMQRFDVMETKYGTVSEELREISRNLKEFVDFIKVFKPKDQ